MELAPLLLSVKRSAQVKFAESAEAAKQDDPQTHVEALRFQGQTLDKLRDPRCKEVLTKALTAARELDVRSALPQEANVLLRLGAHAASVGEPGITEKYQCFIPELIRKESFSSYAACPPFYNIYCEIPIFVQKVTRNLQNIKH